MIKIKTLMITLLMVLVLIFSLIGTRTPSMDDPIDPDYTRTAIADTQVEIKIKDLGIIEIGLYDMNAPITVDNFLKYVDDGFYDGLIFHRVIEGFMIQGGGFYQNMTEKKATYPPIKNEASSSDLSNIRGTIAMARTSDPDSATTQFFINTVDNDFLDAGGNSGEGYSVFGYVSVNMSVIDKIENVTTQSENGHSDVPVEDVVIEYVKIVQRAPDEDNDRDKDGLPNYWEEDHGLDPDNPDDANFDPDDDGKTNKEEYLNGTDPMVKNAQQVNDDDDDNDPNQFEYDNTLIIIILLLGMIVVTTIVVIVIIVIRIMRKNVD